MAKQMMAKHLETLLPRDVKDRWVDSVPLIFALASQHHLRPLLRASVAAMRFGSKSSSDRPSSSKTFALAVDEGGSGSDGGSDDGPRRYDPSSRYRVKIVAPSRGLWVEELGKKLSGRVIPSFRGLDKDIVARMAPTDLIAFTTAVSLVYSPDSRISWTSLSATHF